MKKKIIVSFLTILLLLIGLSLTNITNLFKVYAVGNQTYSISGMVWHDHNSDGKYDTGEKLQSYVKVNLLNKAGNILQTTKTNEQGIYTFTNLTPEEYIVEFERDKIVYNLTYYKRGGIDEKINSDVAEVNGTAKTDIIKITDKNIENINAGFVTRVHVVMSRTRNGVSGGAITREDLDAHINGIFCVERLGMLPAIYDGSEDDGTLGGRNGRNVSGLESTQTIGHVQYDGAFQGVYNPPVEGKSLSTAHYSSIGLRQLDPVERYILAHQNDELAQDNLWDYCDGYYNYVLPSGGTASNILEEARVYNYIIKNIKTPKLTSKDATVTYSFTTKDFLIGPFSIDYTRYYIYGCNSSDVVKKEGRKINFSGIVETKLELDNDTTLNLKKDNFVYPSGRVAGALAESDYNYPYPNEVFYIRISKNDIGNARWLNNINFKFQEFIDGTGSAYELRGKYTVMTYSGGKKEITCPGGDYRSGHYGVDGEWIDGYDEPCEHGKYHSHHVGWEESLYATAHGKLEAQHLISVNGVVEVDKIYELINFSTRLPLCMNYGGIVWEDSRTGKEQELDGLYSINGLAGGTEKGVENVCVTIYNKETNMPYATTYTGEDGRYMFYEIEMGQYYAIFEYDGQVWEDTLYFVGGEDNFEINSKAQEYDNERIDFNNKFKEIIEEGGMSEDGSTITPIEYDTNTMGKPYAITNSGNKALSEAGNFYGSELSNYGGKVEGDYENFKVRAVTMDNNYNIISYPREDEIHIEDWNKQIASTTYTALYPKIEQINLGLARRLQTDFDIKKDVYKVIVQVNGKTQEYTYSGRQNITESFDVEIKTSPEYADMQYNRALYRSDYNYRISDYSTGQSLTNDSDRKEDDIQDLIDGITSAKTGTEMRVFVVYKITYRNVSEVYAGTVNEIVDYYDEEYSYTGESWYGTPTSTENVVTWTENPKYGTAKEYPGLDTLYTTTTSNIMLQNSEVQEIYIKFEVKKHTDERGKENSIWLDENSETGEALGGKNNIVEITNYSTYKDGTSIEQKDQRELVEGRIDRDSWPDETDPNNKATIEDDTDGAPTMNIVLHKGAERNVGGLVWEDTRNNTLENGQIIGNGIREEEETLIDGAVVQLIEKIEYEGQTYEYIWREMESGDGTYKYLDYDGNVQTGSLENSKGRYFFEDYIPGNFIVRIIYGDNVSTIQTTEHGGKNDISYNGQDYKTTIYKGYDLEGRIYDLAQNAQNPNTSKFRDNAVKRLEVNNYSKTMGNHIGNVLASPYRFPEDDALIQELRDNTWMYADTAVIIAEVEFNTKATTRLEDSQNVQAIYQVENVGMGLEERPRTNLVLTKQIENVVMTLEDGETLLDTANGIRNSLKQVPNIYSYQDDNPEKTKYVDRNLWSFETDEEFLQGSQLKIYYRLTITNNGEVDSVGQSYDLSRVGNVSLEEAEQMLGNAYYYGNTEGVRIVTTSVDKIIDYVDKAIAFNPEAETNPTNKWGEVDIKDLQDAGILSKHVNITNVTTNNKSIMTDVLKPDALNPQDNTQTSTVLLLSRVLGRNSEEQDYEYNNITEIIEFSNTVGRRDPDQISGNADPHVINKVNPGNPSNQNDLPDVFETENDTDMSEQFFITTPTGANKNVALIVLAIGMTGVLLVIGIVGIKKFVLK